MDPPSPKRVVRAQVRAALRGVPARRWVEDSRRLVGNLLREPRLAGARTIMAFAPMPEEADIMAALRTWLDQGARICLPRIDWEALTISPVALQVLAPPELIETTQGIREPAQQCQVVGVDEVEVVLVPGLAFSREPTAPGAGGFARLGKGKGFYDRFLAQRSLRALTLGIAMSEQVVQDVPMEPWDVPVAGLATPDGVRWAR